MLSNLYVILIDQLNNAIMCYRIIAQYLLSKEIICDCVKVKVKIIY